LQGGAAYAPGEVGQTVRLNGINGHVVVPGSSSLNVGVGDGLTIEGWINPATTAAQRPLVEWNNGSTSYGWGTHFWISAGSGEGLSVGSLYANAKDTSGEDHYFFSTPGLVVTNQFQHVAPTYDKSLGVGTLCLTRPLI
jgi:hypothetical protein